MWDQREGGAPPNLDTHSFFAKLKSLRQSKVKVKVLELVSGQTKKLTNFKQTNKLANLIYNYKLS